MGIIINCSKSLIRNPIYYYSAAKNTNSRIDSLEKKVINLQNIHFKMNELERRSERLNDQVFELGVNYNRSLFERVCHYTWDNEKKVLLGGIISIFAGTFLYIYSKKKKQVEQERLKEKICVISQQKANYVVSQLVNELSQLNLKEKEMITTFNNELDKLKEQINQQNEELEKLSKENITLKGFAVEKDPSLAKYFIHGGL